MDRRRRAMKKALHVFLSAVLAAGTMGAALASTGSQANARLNERLSGEVRHELAMIPQVSVFDNLAYSVDGGTVTLLGEGRNAGIKDEAERSVKHLEGVERGNNKIEILPVSFNDDRIRRPGARAVFNSGALFNYSIQPVPPIRIIVKNGHVDLEGVVRTEADKNNAFIHANGVPGVFSVKNNLKVEQQKG